MRRLKVKYPIQFFLQNLAVGSTASQIHCYPLKTFPNHGLKRRQTRAHQM